MAGVREKHVRPDPRSQPPKPDSSVVDKTSGGDSNSCSNPMGFRGGFNEMVQNPIINPSYDDFLSDYYTHEKLKKLLLEKVELLYHEAINKLEAMGYDVRVILEAISMNGRCYGHMDPLTNILYNAQLYLNSTEANGCKDKLVNTKKVYPNLKQLTEASLSSLVCMLRRNNPCSSIRDAMWCLHLSDLHVIRPNSMKIPDAQSPNDDGDGITTQMDDEQPVWSDPTPSMLVLLKDHASFLAEEYTRLEKAIDQLDGDSSSSVENDSNVSLEVLSVKNQERTKSILKKFQDMNLEKDSESLPEGQEDEMLLSLMNEIKDLEIQVMERKKWAYEKAVQAAKRLCEDCNELKKLRMERENNERMKPKSILDIDHPTMKSLIDVEMTLRKASEQVDRALMVMKHLELVNLEIRSEIEAAKLSASESITQRLEAAKREKKHNKKISTWEKQKGKLQEDVTFMKQKLVELLEEILQIEAARNTAEAKWREEQESKKHVVARVKQERRLTEQSELNNKRRHESLFAKMDLDFKCHKDDIQRLEQELSRVKSWTDQDHDRTSLCGTQFDDESIGKLLHGSGVESDDEDVVVDHECVICEENVPAVVFLPCAHEVVCVDCNEELKKDECPTCGVLIEQRIRVFGGSS